MGALPATQRHYVSCKLRFTLHWYFHSTRLTFAVCGVMRLFW